MARRTSPLKVKQQLANERETRILQRERRDDGVPRRLEREPLTAADLRAKSRERKPFVPAYVELAKQARIARKYGREAFEMRARFLG
jgi:hypothetical protein